MKDDLETQRLEELLAGRKEEYTIFGATAEDKEKDAQIIDKIAELKNGNNKKS